MEKETIKKRIKALLAKTTENGASENEAISALYKAKELMIEYFISENDLKDPFAFEKCVFKEVKREKSGYDLTLFLGYLSKLFDCEYFYNRSKVTFFGFEQDADLCVYFYDFILRSCLSEKDKYMKSNEVKVLKSMYHGKTLASAFIKGFLVAISEKMDDMYKDRNRTIEQKAGLVVFDKMNKVTQQYQEQNIKVRKVQNRLDVMVESAFLQGQERGNKVELIQGIKEQQKETLMLANGYMS